MAELPHSSQSQPETCTHNPPSLIPVALRARLALRQCVAYVGAGFSMACGMPNWRGLLDELIKAARAAECSGRAQEYRDPIAACEQAIDSGHYIMAASILRKLLSP